MTIIYALKDNLSGEYLTKASTLQRLSTTTRTFQTKSKAHKVARDNRTYFWMAVNEFCAGQPKGYRVNISDEKFKKYVLKLQFDRPLEVVSVNIKEFYNTQVT